MDNKDSSKRLNPVTRVEQNTSFSEAAIAIIENCKFCGDTHQHGIPSYEERLEVGLETNRSSHCKVAQDYSIVITEDTDIQVDLPD